MANIRPLSSNTYDVSKHKFWELYHYCMQYNEWKQELMYCTDDLKGVQISDMPHGNGVGDSTSHLAIKREILSHKCELIENTAKEVSPELWKYILKNVTNEGITYGYLQSIAKIPCSKNTFYKYRRKFYFLLSKKI